MATASLLTAEASTSACVWKMVHTDCTRTQIKIPPSSDTQFYLRESELGVFALVFTYNDSKFKNMKGAWILKHHLYWSLHGHPDSQLGVHYLTDIKPLVFVPTEGRMLNKSKSIVVVSFLKIIRSKWDNLYWKQIQINPNI